MFTMSLAKPANPPSVGSGQHEDKTVNITLQDYPGSFAPSQVFYSISRWRHHKQFHLSTSTSTVPSAIFHSSRTVKTSQPVQPAESAQIADQPALSRTNWRFSGPPNHPKTIISCMFFPKNKKAHCPTLTYPHSTL